MKRPYNLKEDLGNSKIIQEYFDLFRNLEFVLNKWRKATKESLRVNNIRRKSRHQMTKGFSDLTNGVIDENEYEKIKAYEYESQSLLIDAAFNEKKVKDSLDNIISKISNLKSK